jgi:phytoene synthase
VCSAASRIPTLTVADELGVALQQTNILPDIHEDLGNGRVYRPREELHSFGVEPVIEEPGSWTPTAGCRR